MFIPGPGYDGTVMMRILDLRDVALTPKNSGNFVPRLEVHADELDDTVAALLAEVKAEGSTALRRQAEKFDGVAPESIRVCEADLKKAASELDSTLKKALEESIRRVRAASEDMVPATVVTNYHSGGQVMTRFVPVDRAGVYVPGGKAVYPSSVVMNVVAAQAAGVTDIVLVSPPQQDFAGGIHPTIAAAAHLLGVTEVYAMGGAGAIAALTWGVPDLDLEPVSVIAGPGNRYVATAKKLVKGHVAIDSEAGPTEICIIADETAHPELVAADLVSQAEHDELASAILITTSMELGERVQLALARKVGATHHAARVREALTGQQSALMVLDSLEQCIDMANAVASEHLEVMVENPDVVLDGIRHAGAIFVGNYTPVSAGDYLAGSNHVLPTAGTARFTSGLSPFTFLKTQQVVEYDEAGLRAISDMIVTLAKAENLPAHGDAVLERFSETTEL